MFRRPWENTSVLIAALSPRGSDRWRNAIPGDFYHQDPAPNPVIEEVADCRFVQGANVLTRALGDGKPQLIYYSVGVNGFLGGAFGEDSIDNIRLAYEWLIENYRDGDEIFIFGFSRGAYTARALAGLIAIDGLLQQGSPIGVSELFDRYKRSDEKTIWELKEMTAGELAKRSPRKSGCSNTRGL